MSEQNFSDLLVAANQAAWDAAVGHRFTVELGEDVLPDEVYRRYLIQDYAFIETLVAMVGYAVAKAPGMAAKSRLSAFLAAVTSDENTYFQRSFDALGVSETERTRPALAQVSKDLLAAMGDAGETGGYEDIIATLLPAEWIYLSWARTQAAKPVKRFYLKEWIDLHANPDFEDFVMWLKGELDATGPRLSPERQGDVAARFGRMVALEVAFFDAAYHAPDG